MHTLTALIDRHGIEVHEHLDRDDIVPVLDGLQLQGDVAVVPGKRQGTDPIPAAGLAVVRGENGGNTHALLADGPALYTPRTNGLLLGFLTVPEGAAAYLAHPEHGYLGIAPGSYELRRQREQAEEMRLVAD
jgi:hypothetical protein